jgi:hypothetical protein
MKIFKGGMNLKRYEFLKPNKASILFSTQCISCVSNTEANSAYIFNGASIHVNICKH